MVEKYLLESIWPPFFSGIYKVDNYPLIISRMLLHCTGSGDTSFVRAVKFGGTAFNSRRKDC